MKEKKNNKFFKKYFESVSNPNLDLNVCYLHRYCNCIALNTSKKYSEHFEIISVKKRNKISFKQILKRIRKMFFKFTLTLIK